jgi:hypothetical protein
MTTAKSKPEHTDMNNILPYELRKQDVYKQTSAMLIT